MGAGSAGVVKLLLDAGASVDPRDVRGFTPLMWAAGTDHPEPNVVRALLAAGADTSIQSTAGESVLNWAGKYNDAKILTALNIQSGAPSRIYRRAEHRRTRRNGPATGRHMWTPPGCRRRR